MEHKSYITLLLSVLFLTLLEWARGLSIQIIPEYQETMLCHSHNETMLAKGGKNGELIVLGKNVAQLFCPWVVITYRLVAAHTRLRGPLFRRHSSASWWSHHGGIWPGWSHSLLWCSHPRPADHFCKTGNVPSATRPLYRPHCVFHFPFVKMHATPEGLCGRSLRGCGRAPGVGYRWRCMRDTAIPLLLTGVLWTLLLDLLW